MLTPNEVHFLVGLLTMVSRPDGLEIELGSMVYDSSAEEERDVDITVRSVNEQGVISAFDGIEVKNHSRPLDVTHVEQLCIKLRDMPDVTDRAIVSASGFSEPAIRKAKRNDVGLFVLKDWSGHLEDSGITIAEGMTIQERGLQWVDSPHVTLNPNMHISDKARRRITPKTKVTNSLGHPVPNTPDFQSLADSFASRATALAAEQGQPVDIEVGSTKNVTFNLRVEFDVFLDLGNQRIPVESAQVSGNLTQSEKVIVPQLKALVRLEDDKPYAGCALFEMSHGNLAGLTVDRHSRTVRMINIPVADRLLKKIYRRRLT
jgi:hypothetical protein